MSLFRTVRQAEPFREMGKFLGMTVVAGGALYFVNEPVAAFFYTRQAAQEETRRRQEAAARAHQEVLAKEREEHMRQVGLAEEYLRQLETRVYTGGPAVGLGKDGERDGSDGNNGHNNISGSSAASARVSSLSPASLVQATPEPSKQPRQLDDERGVLHVAPPTALPNKYQPRPSSSSLPPTPPSPSSSSRSFPEAPPATPLTPARTPERTVVDDLVLPATSDEAVASEANQDDVESKPEKNNVYNWKSASRRMIEERKGLF